MVDMETVSHAFSNCDRADSADHSQRGNAWQTCISCMVRLGTDCRIMAERLNYSRFTSNPIKNSISCTEKLYFLVVYQLWDPIIQIFVLFCQSYALWGCRCRLRPEHDHRLPDCHVAAKAATRTTNLNHEIKIYVGLTGFVNNR